ncbi:taste receptor type 1 member 2 [Crotalus adamanteus]|uniref:Taste receptor type 1 member 2 n=1 Tax=Crotalus adamanteus TaxID=8729 RepID=A0AAW1AQG4_CROAD
MGLADLDCNRRCDRLRFPSAAVLADLSEGTNDKDTPVFCLARDYILGGDSMQKQRAPLPPRYPQVPVCKQDTQRMASSSYFQAMRFAVEENSNSTSLLPGILLGYEMMDICYLTHPVHPILCFLTDNCSTIQIQRNCTLSYPGALSVIGPDSSPAAIRVASILSHVLIPQRCWESQNSQVAGTSGRVGVPTHLEGPGLQGHEPHRCPRVSILNLPLEDPPPPNLPAPSNAARGSLSCCFECVACEAGTFPNDSDRFTCQKCPPDTWPRSLLRKRSWCTCRGTIPPPSCCSSSPPSATLPILTTLAHHANTPVVKLTCGRLCFLMLSSLVFGFCSVFSYMGFPPS